MKLKPINIEQSTINNLLQMVDMLDVRREHQTPVEFCEANRVLTRAETAFPGPMDMSIVPYFIQPLDQMDPFDPTREIIILKGVKTAYTTAALENAVLYFLAYLSVYPGMFFSADKELAQGRVASNIIPMLNNSGFRDIFKTVDEFSNAKTGKTKQRIEVIGGGSLDVEGAKNADKLRQFAPMAEFIDEFAAFAEQKLDGDTMRLIRDRCQGFWLMRKILMGTTPLGKGGYPDVHFARGNQQDYHCACLKCGYEDMWLKFSQPDLRDPNIKRGLRWDYDAEGAVDDSSIRYECWNCGHGHQEKDKPKFISIENSKWVAKAKPVEKGIESYRVPGIVSRLAPWSKHVADYHAAYSRDGKIQDVGALKVFYNNVLGFSFSNDLGKLKFQVASAHRRSFYRKGEIPNSYIAQYCESEIMVALMTVDVGAHALNLAVWGFTVGGNPWIIDSKKLMDESEAGCKVLDSVCWVEVQRMIDEQEYVADDGKKYWIEMTFIDSGYNESVVSEFCAQWDYGVYAIKGDSYSGKRIVSFKDFKTSAGQHGYMIAVDHYKDRMAPVLRREWSPEMGNQGRYHFNAPVDATDAEIKELTMEYKRTSIKAGREVRAWYRPPGSNNELWDLLIYAMAALDVLAHNTCIGHLQLDETVWPDFWQLCGGKDPLFFELP